MVMYRKDLVKRPRNGNHDRDSWNTFVIVCPLPSSDPSKALLTVNLLRGKSWLGRTTWHIYDSHGLNSFGAPLVSMKNEKPQLRNKRMEKKAVKFLC